MPSASSKQQNSTQPHVPLSLHPHPNKNEKMIRAKVKMWKILAKSVLVVSQKAQNKQPGDDGNYNKDP